jgi:hypothetical protein
MRERASEEEWAVIGDGLVTRGEFHGAFQAAEACTVAAATAVGGVELDPPDMTGEFPRFGMMRSPSKGSIDRVGDAHLKCVGRYFDDVLAAWDMERTYTAYQPLWDRTADCLATRGYAAKHGMDRRQLAESVGSPGDAIPDFYDCEASAGQPAARED